MIKINGHEVEQLIDPTGILQGERFEFFLSIDVPEDDELYSEQGVLLRVIFGVIDDVKKILYYEFIERNTNEVLDFALDDEELEMVNKYCSQIIDDNDIFE